MVTDSITIALRPRILYKQKELDITPMTFKFVLHDLISYYKIINLFAHIKLPEHFTFVEAEQVRYTRQTSAIINFAELS